MGAVDDLLAKGGGGKSSSVDKLLNKGSGRGGGSSVGKLLGKGPYANGKFDPKALQAAADEKQGPGPGFTPVRLVLDTVSRPSYIIGNLLAGKPLEAAKNLSVIPIGAEKTTPSKALEKLGVDFGDGWAGVGAKVGIDIVTDPLTYLTFGAGGAAKGLAKGAASGVAQRAAAEAARAAAKDGGRVGYATIGRNAADDLAERLAAESAGKAGIKVGVRVPLTRGKTFSTNVKGSRRVMDAFTRLGHKVPGSEATDDLVKLNLAPSRGVDERVNVVVQSIRRAGQAENRERGRTAVALERELSKAVKKAKVSRPEANRLINTAIDENTIDDLPEPLAEVARSLRQSFDDLGKLDTQAGIDFSEIPDGYIPYRFATQKDREVFDQRFGDGPIGANALDNPAFVKPRQTESYRQFVEFSERNGLKVEENPAKLYEIRARESVRARMSKGTQDAIAERYGEQIDTFVEARQSSKVSARPVYDEARLSPEERAEVDRLYWEAMGSDSPQRYHDRIDAIREGARVRDEEFTYSAPVYRVVKKSRSGRPLTDDEIRQVQDEWADMGTRYYSDTKLPPEIREAWSQAQEVMAPQINRSGFLRGARNFMSRWKGLALTSPGYHLRNFQDDGFRAYLAGARNPATFRQAHKILHGKGGTLRAKIDGEWQTFNKEEAIALMESMGVISNGWISSEVLSSATGKIGRKVRGPGQGPIVRTSGRVGEWREDVTRAFLFMERLKAGDDIYTAARITREFLFDYGEVGRFVEWARSYWMPFATFTSKALPLAVKQTARRPGTLANFNKLQQAVYEKEGSPDLSLLPRGSESSFVLPGVAATALNQTAGRIPFIGPQVSDGETLLLDPRSVNFFSQLDLIDPRPERLKRNVVNLLGPGVKTPIELSMGKSYFTDRDFPKTGAKAPLTIQLLAKAGLPVPGYATDRKTDYQTGEKVPSYSPYLDTILRSFPPFSQSSSVIPSSSDAPTLGGARYFGGLPVSTYDRAQARALAEKYGDR